VRKAGSGEKMGGCARRRFVGAARALAVLVAVAVLGAAPAAGASASDRPIVVGEVTTGVSRGDVDLRALLRTTLERELALRDVGHPAGRDRAVVVSVRLLSLDTVAGRRTTSVSCAVSVALRGARDGALFGVLEGRARLDDGAMSPRAAERTALSAAVRSALAGLSEALR
jgi:hypothetical protein